MKINAQNVPAFLRRPDPAIRFVLVYGPDAGLVTERARELAGNVVADLADPFRVVELTGQALQDDPARLQDEAAAIALTGGRRVVRIRELGDRNTKTVVDFLKFLPGDALVVGEASELAPRSSLRKLCEGDKRAAALPCYGDDAGAIAELAQKALSAEGLTIAADALTFLQSVLGSDRRMTRMELDKLVLYAGNRAEPISLEEVQACAGDIAARSIDDVVYAAVGGDTDGLERALSYAFQSGENPIAILRSTARHLQRLHLATGYRTQGVALENALKKLRPPVFFKQKSAFSAHLSMWKLPRLASALDLIYQAEVDCKSTGIPDQAVCRAALLRLAAAARSARAHPG